MRGFRFSLRWLFGMVSFLAVGCGLLFYATPLLSKLTFTVAILVLLSAVAAAIYQSREHRAFWAGFAAFGLAYLWLTCGVWQSPDGSMMLRDSLVTTEILGWCYEELPQRQTALVPVGGTVGYAYVDVTSTYTPSAMPGGPMPTTVIAGSNAAPPMVSGTTLFMSPAVNRMDFFTVGHSLFTIALALLGGMITRRCYHIGNSRTPNAEP